MIRILMAKNILIIDDDVELCEEIAEILRYEGYLVECVFDSFQGDEKFKNNKNKYDIVIVDFKMPGVNGIETLKRIKEKTPHIKTILISGRPFIEEITPSQKLSNFIDVVLSKPFDIEALLKKIKSLVTV